MIDSPFRLRQLQITDSELVEGRAVQEVIRKSTQLQVLSLAGNRISHDFINDVYGALANNDKLMLKVVDLARNRINVQAVIKLSPLLDREQYLGRSLRVLDLSQNKLQNIGCESLALALCHNERLLYLDVSYNELADRALYYLAEMLSHTTSLRYLAMIGNHFTSKVLFQLAMAICSNVRSQLQIMKMGLVECSEIEMTKFIQNGLVFSSLHYLHI
jgi:Ran GTPase-activating protein (RanGAP) involved in mRNA processing and transport